MKKRLAILGSTGSIGKSALQVISQYPERFSVVSLAAARSVELLAAQAREFAPQVIAVADAQTARRLADLLPDDLAARVTHGPQGYLEAAVGCGPDMALSAMVGAAGLVPTFAAVKAGVTVALANKETLVAGGELVMAEAARRGVTILPVDSEHSAIYQSLMGNRAAEVRRILLTASGGPFRNLSRRELASVTPQQALAHPNWSMGPKITIDSATLMNKGLEVIEARWLFDQPLTRIEVLIHPQSVVHSAVEFVDGSVMAQMGIPDMRLPIAFALAHPERLPLDLPSLDLLKVASLTFEAPDRERFPALSLAYSAAAQGGMAPAVLSAANEVAVEGFLSGRIGFHAITACVSAVLDSHPGGQASSIAAVLEADRWGRSQARAWLREQTP